MDSSSKVDTPGDIDAQKDFASKVCFDILEKKAPIQKMVLEYLAEHGLYKAAVSLKQELDINYVFPPLLKEREGIRDLAEAGEFLGVLEKTSMLSPCIFSDYPMLYLLIVKQDILEDVYIRNKTEGVALARIEKEISPVVEAHPSLLSELETLVGAIVFRSLAVNSVIKSRLEIFEAVNRKLLILLDYEMNGSLEKFVKKAERASFNISSIFTVQRSILKDLFKDEDIKKSLL